MKITLNENLYNFCQDLNNVQWIKENFSVIVLDTWRVELYFNDKASAHIDNENSRPYKKFKKLLDKYDLEYDLIRYKCIEVWEE